jgi:two-component system alkaline phosphatase synthesis response regulator PhoP
MRVLVIDDEAHIRSLVSYNLELCNNIVFVASNGLKGLEIAKKEELDLILLDIMMPVMNGFNTLSRLKNDGKTKNLPVIMLTSKSQLKDVEKAFKYGADNYITKPFPAQDLYNLIQMKMNKCST